MSDFQVFYRDGKIWSGKNSKIVVNTTTTTAAPTTTTTTASPATTTTTTTTTTTATPTTTGTPVLAQGISSNIASETYSGVTYQWLGLGTSGNKLRTNISTCWGVGNPLLWTRWQFTCNQTGYLNVEWAGHGEDSSNYYANITQVLRNGVAVDIRITNQLTDTGTQPFSTSQKFFVLAGDVIKFSFNTGANTMCGSGPLGFIQLWIENPDPISVPALGQWSGNGSAASPYLYTGAASEWVTGSNALFVPQQPRVFASQNGTVHWAGYWRGHDGGDDEIGVARVLKNGAVVVSTAEQIPLAPGSVSVNTGDVVQFIGRSAWFNQGALRNCRSQGGCSGDNHTRIWFVPS